MPILTYLKLGALAFALAAGGWLWLTIHNLRAELKDATRDGILSAQMAANLADELRAEQDLNAKERAAANAAADALALLQKQRTASVAALRATLDTEGSANAALRRCLSMPLPRSVLDGLAR